MNQMPDRFATTKGERALQLHEKYGLDIWEIAERLGVKPSNVNGMIQRAKERRERQQ